jgi:uncharacterized membrane protein
VLNAVRSRVAAVRWRRPVDAVWSDPLPYVLAVVAAAVYALVAIVQYSHFTNGYDLAIFDQAAWHWSRFELPRSTLFTHIPSDPLAHVTSQLGDHFDPILLVVAPLYWMWASPVDLLVVQAVLAAAAVVPIHAFARDRLGRVGAAFVAVSYVAFWGVQTAVTSDFHEVAFAPLLIACAILGASRERWRGCFVALGLLLLVKEDMPFFVATFGLWLLLVRRWKPAGAVILASVLWYPLVTRVLMPAAGGNSFRYWRYHAIGNSPSSALKRIAGSVTLPFLVAIDTSVKAETMLFLFGAFLFLPLWSPLLLLTAPLLAERMLSDTTVLWGTSFHYSLTIAPILAMAAADGLRNLLDFFAVERRRTLAVAVVGVLLVGIGIDLSRTFPLAEQLHTRAFYTRTAEDRTMAAAIALIPRHHDSVAADGTFIPRVSERTRIWHIGPQNPVTDWVIYREDPTANRDAPGYVKTILATMASRRARYRLVFDKGDVRVWKLK